MAESDLALVLHHIYANGMAWDVSGYNNHGTPYDVANADPGFTYDEPSSRVVVAPSASLSDLIAINAGVIFSIAEGYKWTLLDAGLFGLRVTSEHGLSGWIVLPNGDQVAIGRQLGEGFVSQNAQHQAELFYDGMTQASLWLDGVEVASSCVGAGPIGSIGADGITIGSAPVGEADVAGTVFQSWLYKFDPVKAAKNLLDPKCPGYLEAIDAVAVKLRRRGFTGDRARAKGMEMLKFALGNMTQLCGTDVRITRQVSQLAIQALAALKAGDSTAYSNAIAHVAAIAAGKLTTSQLQALHDQEYSLIRSLPLPVLDFQQLLAKMCLRRAKLSPIAVIEAVSRATGTTLTQSQIDAVIAATAAEEARIGQ